MQAYTTPQYTETELEWLIYQLWSKTTARAPQFSFDLADTIVLRAGAPQNWYFSSKEGYILKKNHQNVRVGKICKRFNKKNGMLFGSQEDMPAATTFLYKPQRNMETGGERMSLRIGYVAGRDLAQRFREWASPASDNPHMVQMFVAPKHIKNNVIKVVWSTSNMQMVRYCNKQLLSDQRYTLATRSVTVEDAEDLLFAEKVPQLNTGRTFELIRDATWEIHAHIKKNSGINLTAGTFFYKCDDSERPVLLFATQLKTERPILVLNPHCNFAITMEEQARIVSEVPKPTLSEKPKIVMAQPETKSAPQRQDQFKTDEDFTAGGHLPEIIHNQELMDIQVESTGRSLQQSTSMRPPIGPQPKGSKPGLGFSTCPFCANQLEASSMAYELTVNQIIRLYEYFESQPAGLLLIAASSTEQQKFFDAVYQQVVSSKQESALEDKRHPNERRQSVHSGGLQCRTSLMIPQPLQTAFDLSSVNKYTVLRNDLSFIYKTLKICSFCFSCVKAMLGYQASQQKRNNSRGSSQIRQDSVASKQQPRTPLSQGWVLDSGLFAKSDSNGRPIGITDMGASTDEVFSEKANSELPTPDAKLATMFHRVQAGKEVSQARKQQVPRTGVEAEDLKKLARKNKGVRQVNEATLPLSMASQKATSLKNTSSKVGKPLSETSDDRPMKSKIAKLKYFSKNLPASAHFKGKVPNLNIQDKMQMRDARRKISKKEQLQAQMFAQHRILIDPLLHYDPNSQASSLNQVEDIGVYQLGQGQTQQTSQLLPKHNTQFGAKAPGKMRPISAKPFVQSYSKGRIEITSEAKEIYPSLQPVDEYAVPIFHKQLSSGAPVTAVESLEGGGSQHPFVYTPMDAAKVYLNSVNQSDINSLPGQQQRTSLQQRITSQRLMNKKSGQTRQVIPVPTKKNFLAMNKQQAWKKTNFYPVSKIGATSKSPARKASTSDQPGVTMFNYSSNKSQAGMSTNIVVPQDGKSPQADLTASLLNVHNMQLQDMEQIAQNADNLIQILQQIKQAKLQKDAEKVGVAEETQLAVNQISESEQRAEKGDTANEEPPQDFWDSHTRSPLQQKNKVLLAAEKDLWGDDTEVRVLPEDCVLPATPPAHRAQDKQVSLVEREDRVDAYTGHNRPEARNLRASKRQSVERIEPVKKKTNSDLIVKDSSLRLTSPGPDHPDAKRTDAKEIDALDSSNYTLISQLESPERVKSNAQTAKAGALMMFERVQARRTDPPQDQFAIPEPFDQDVAVYDLPKQQPSEPTTDQLPSSMVDKIEDLIKRRVEVELAKRLTRKESAGGAALKPRTEDPVDEFSVSLDNKRNSLAAPPVYAVVDNRFFSSSANSQNLRQITESDKLEDSGYNSTIKESVKVDKLVISGSIEDFEAIAQDLNSSPNVLESAVIGETSIAESIVGAKILTAKSEARQTEACEQAQAKQLPAKVGGTEGPVAKFDEKKEAPAEEIDAKDVFKKKHTQPLRQTANAGAIEYRKLESMTLSQYSPDLEVERYQLHRYSSQEEVVVDPCSVALSQTVRQQDTTYRPFNEVAVLQSSANLVMVKDNSCSEKTSVAEREEKSILKKLPGVNKKDALRFSEEAKSPAHIKHEEENND